MSELVFGPSADWLPLAGLENECLQPRLDGGYDMPKIKRIGSFICNKFIQNVPNPNQPSLFDEIDDTICEIQSTEIPTLFDETNNQH